MLEEMTLTMIFFKGQNIGRNEKRKNVTWVVVYSYMKIMNTVRENSHLTYSNDVKGISKNVNEKFPK